MKKNNKPEIGAGAEKAPSTNPILPAAASAPNALVSRDCLRNLLNNIYGNHEYFKPTKRFYDTTGINPHRWAKLYRGDASITIDELKPLCKALNVEFSAETFLRQLRLFD